jgi:tetratricopeptide (TPR) repeat protein
MAQRVGDRSAHSWVLVALAQLLTASSPSRPTELLAVSKEHLRLMDTVGVVVKKASIYRRMALAAIQLGRRNDADDWLEHAETLARAENRRVDLHNALMIHAAIAIAEGRFDEAKSIAAHSHDVGRGAHNAAVTLAYAAQVSAIRSEQGRTDKVIADFQNLLTDTSPMTVAWRVMLAALYADVGRLENARDLFGPLTADRFSLLPRDWSFPLAIRYLAELCAHLGDTERALELLPELRSYSGQILVATLGTSIEGAADRSLGQLYAVLGRLDDADRCYRSATQLEDSTGFPALAARTRYWHARLLLAFAHTGNRLRARNLLHTTLSTSSVLGMTLLHRQARHLYESLDQGL